MSTLNLSFAFPMLAKEYHHSDLSQEDKHRLLKYPNQENKLNWKVSRALKHILHLNHPKNRHQDVYSHVLSHKSGHALVCHGSVSALGADLEKLQARNFTSLSLLFCHKDELDYLSLHQYNPLIFYYLWTLKEALIKAENLTFPASLTKVGLRYKHNKDTILVSPKQDNWQSHTLIIDQTWLANAVYSPKNNQTIEPHVQFFGAKHTPSCQWMEPPNKLKPLNQNTYTISNI